MLSRISILYLLLGGEGTIITLFTLLLETGINVREITFANLPSRYRRDTSWHTWPDIISKSATPWIEFFPSRTRSIIDSTSPLVYGTSFRMPGILDELSTEFVNRRGARLAIRIT